MRPAPRRPGNSSTWSVIRAPAESTSQKTGSSCRSACSVSRTIFSTVRAPHEPAFTVGSLAMTHTGRPSTRPTPVTTPSAGRSSARLLASSPSSTNESLSRSDARRSRTNSLPCAASLSPTLARLPASARPVRRASSSVGPSGGRLVDSAPGRSVTPSTLSRATYREHRHVVVHRLRGEVTRRLEQVLAQHAGGHAGVAPQRVGDALLAEDLLAVAHLGETVGVEQQQVAHIEGDLSAVVAPVGVEHEQRSGRPQGPHLAVVPQPRGRVPGRGEAQRAAVGVEQDHH